MIQIALSQIKAIKLYAKSGVLKSKKHKKIPENSEFTLPTFKQQINYWIKQKIVR